MSSALSIDLISKECITRVAEITAARGDCE
jgi:hypothetical protein